MITIVSAVLTSKLPSHNASLAGLHTFGIDCKASLLFTVKQQDDLQVLQELLRQYPTFLILGGGSNILFTKDYPGLIVLNRIKGISAQPDPDNDRFVLLTAAGGEVWHDVVLYAVQKGWGGLENLSLIPGTVGAAPIQNIGAYGVELKDVFHHLEALDLETGELHTFDKANCMFGYRNSIFKHELAGKYLITSVTLRLDTRPELKLSYGAIQDTLGAMGITEPNIADVSQAVISIRQSKLPDPAELGNAGSFFKNPEISRKHYEQLQMEYPDIPGYPGSAADLVKVPAGWLIETCGWKGRRTGNTGAHSKQALVLVNYGNATGIEIWEHAQRIMRNIKERFEISLTPEVNVI